MKVCLHFEGFNLTLHHDKSTDMACKYGAQPRHPTHSNLQPSVLKGPVLLVHSSLFSQPSWTSRNMGVKATNYSQSKSLQFEGSNLTLHHDLNQQGLCKYEVQPKHPTHSNPKPSVLKGPILPFTMTST